MILPPASFTSCVTFVLLTISSVSIQTQVSAFTVFPEHNNGMIRSTPSKVPDVQIELPDFDALFDNIREVSPLASMIITQDQSGGDIGGEQGFEIADKKYASPSLKWKKMESSKKGPVLQIDKIENYRDLGCPLIRFRSTIEGPCLGMKFVEYIMDVEERRVYDPQIEVVEQAYPAYDIAAANMAMKFKYGDAHLLGIGYTRTKPVLVVDGREQLTLCGVQEFSSNGGWIIWGVELEERHDHLFPEGVRHVRSKSHLFSITLAPNGENSFDVEYILQLEVGGKLPNFLTTPLLIDTIKGMFKQAKTQFSDEKYMAEWMENYQKHQEAQKNLIEQRLSLLMTP
jgi:hypothetical protein